jgi:hypothetical protein
MMKLQEAKDELRRAMKDVRAMLHKSAFDRSTFFEIERALKEGQKALASDVLWWIRATIRKLRRYR